MAPRKDITKIGKEGFALLEEMYGKKKSPIVQLKTPSNQGRVINNHEAGKFYGGISFSDYSKRKSTTLAY
ncbi:hypothetical protein KY290_001476 [Solanum tuberosum]|uniref:Uncharacterized protein n=2 Tax=Solanum tuberosum TaxID=4113 RepID=A0ABQ7WMB3_SOLTU|nr:hypothetical protein KY289_001641 [Solanum tuberosum]KAH0730462.1 hypothetical protein KY289_001650 [Solanum tuberosum]KAH0765495.1 hypothetical protein KY285_001366 [Solanum tuberosum]KAH0781868.1 hypothetical protein KY290_001466 [Solanum tuberosum]KAH0781878.1 hypothetical protein KY290_001476 [Solanum tuberosum]